MTQRAERVLVPNVPRTVATWAIFSFPVVGGYQIAAPVERGPSLAVPSGRPAGERVASPADFHRMYCAEIQGDRVTG